ncbi:hypothetical protein LCI18_006885 [Fusarium solani-melongenae]|uniref:Uncharacterized protein n=1 Tax=Fusarium solani subsp. cucurbitae TaxID=2747967 RepID=A0ACD3Z4A4_FUSSC|nr:hypothetical protein LCI18_006885 [Fusarium solani-melongenae]
MGCEEKLPYPAPRLTSDKGSQPAAIGFLDLPGTVREGIYKHVLTFKHPVYLFQDFGPRVEAFAPDKPKRWIALLYTNRQISSEAKAVLYGSNNFHLMGPPQKHGALLQAFLGCIGSPNANSLSRLCIGFPVAEEAHGQPHAVAIRQDSLEGLTLVQEQCTGLKTLEMQLCRENSGLLAGAREEDAQLVRDALVRIDAQLKAISSVKKIVVRLSIKGVPPLVVDTMQVLAWVVLDG